MGRLACWLPRRSSRPPPSALLLIRAGLGAESEPPATVPTATRPARTETRSDHDRAHAAGALGGRTTIQEGDTLDQVALDHDTTVERLLELNPRIDPTSLAGRPAASSSPGRVAPVRIRAVVLAAAFAAIVHSSASAATPKIDARAYEVVNAATGEVLLADNARTQLPMASITKLMTVLVALERAKLDDVVEVDRDAVGVTGLGRPAAGGRAAHGPRSGRRGDRPERERRCDRARRSRRATATRTPSSR